MTTGNDSLTLWDIESGLQELVLAREEAETDEQRSQCDEAIRAYVKAEVQKVDGIRAYLKHCDLMEAAAKQEAQRLTAKAKMWEVRRERLKEICQAVMGEVGKRRLEGRVGVLRIQQNGGKRPVLLNAPAMVPEELCQYEGRISGAAWERLRYLLSQVCASAQDAFFGRQDVQMERKPMLGSIGARLEAGEPVPGASLGVKGEHLRVE